jgi:dynactin complex subunit
MKESLSALNSREQFRVGDRVLLDKFYGATIKHFGPVSFASGNWAGLLLDEPKGKNNGTVAGKRYFESPPKHGIFTKQSRITKQPEVCRRQRTLSRDVMNFLLA